MTRITDILLARLEITRLLRLTPRWVVCHEEDLHAYRAERIAAGDLCSGYSASASFYGLPMVAVPWAGAIDLALDNGQLLEAWLQEGQLSELMRAGRDILYMSDVGWSEDSGWPIGKVDRDITLPGFRIVGLWSAMTNWCGHDTETLHRINELRGVA